MENGEVAFVTIGGLIGFKIMYSVENEKYLFN